MRLLFLIASVCYFGIIHSSSAAERPNIILMMADDMGYSDLGCYGGEMETPNLNELAKNGLRFTQFYNTGRCCPTRACLLTGLYPHQAGIGWMMSDRGYDGYRGDLNNHCVTIAQALKPAGYSTYGVGKWHVTKHTQPDGPKFNWPLQRGFERFYGTITGAGSFYDPGTLTRDNTMVSPFADPEYQPDQYYYTNAISDHVVRFIKEHKQHKQDEPFFMYVAYTCAHWPMHALQEDIARYRGKYDKGYGEYRKARLERLRKLGLIDKTWELSPQHGDWENVEHKEWEARCMEVYAAMIYRMDQGIGRIVETLKETGNYDNTLVLFLQDNGGCQEGVGRRGNSKRPAKATRPKIADDAIRLDVIPKQNRAGVPTLQGPLVMPGPEDTYIAYGIDWANVSNTPFREYKHFVHEGGISTPLIAHWPEGISRKGELEPQPGHLIDLMATCVDLAQANYPKTVKGEAIRPMEGVSLVPAFSGKSLSRGDAIFWEHEGNRAVRDGIWKLVAKENQPWELYNMETDRTEMHDLSKKYPERVAEMSRRWDEWAKRANVLPLGGWRGKKQAESKQGFSKKTSFRLKPGADLSRQKAPYVVGASLHIQAKLSHPADNGVIVAQGGSADGYSWYLKDRRLHLAARRGGKLSVVTADNLIPTNAQVLELDYAADGQIGMKADGELVATGTVPGSMTKMPIDGLQVGRDAKGAVGEYESPFAFEGKIDSVTIEVQSSESSRGKGRGE